MQIGCFRYPVLEGKAWVTEPTLIGAREAVAVYSRGPFLVRFKIIAFPQCYLRNFS